MKAYVIITFSESGWGRLFNCYNSLRNYDNITTVIIVNNSNQDLHNGLVNDTTIRYVKNIENGFELNAIKQALYTFDDITQYFIIHDSCEFLDYIPSFKNDTIFFKTTLTDISPVLDEVKIWCDTFFPDVIYNDIHNIMCQGLMGCFSRDTLINVFEYGLNKITINYKHEAVASEGLFGILLQKINPEIETYYEYPVNDYIINKHQWKFLKKM
jgi:hypothetical protein